MNWIAAIAWQDKNGRTHSTSVMRPSELRDMLYLLRESNNVDKGTIKAMVSDTQGEDLAEFDLDLWC